MPNILDLAQLAVQTAMNAGAQWAEASVASGRSVGVIVENSSIRECEVVRDYGIGVRAYHQGGAGSATITYLTEDAARQVGTQAAEMARATHPDPDFRSLPEPGVFTEIEGMWDDALAGLAASTVVDWCRDAIAEARAVAPEVSLSGGGHLGIGERALASSTGVAFMRQGTDVSLDFQAVINHGEDVGAYFEYDAARRLADFEPVGVASKATQIALTYLGARHIESGRLPLVLGPLAVSALIGSSLAAANAEGIQRKRSFMMGKVGELIAAPCLTVREEPLVPAGLGSSPMDAEGVPKVARKLLDAGVLTTYLHNSYTANKAGVPNTAHATRGGYTPSVGIGFGNLQLDLGTRTEAELIADISDGLYIAYGGLQPEGATGDISATVDFGFRIENGALTYPVATTMVGSDAFEMLSHIDAVSSDYRAEPGSVTPSLRVQDIMVVGGG